MSARDGSTFNFITSRDSSISSFYTARDSSASSFYTASSTSRSSYAFRAIESFSRTRVQTNSDWYNHLRIRGLLPNEFDEKNWSGRGQHVEYELHEAAAIPLQVKSVLGFSATALVESVQCRRILLARKTVKCGRQVKREDAITEVEHLQRLRHYHLIQVIGSYVMARDLAILLYPVAEYNLETFMDSIIDAQPAIGRKIASLCFFFGCLSNALEYLHCKNTKHLDIKPKNILVRDLTSSQWNSGDQPVRYNVYIADFGIARSYSSSDACETDTPTSFTRTYSAPEVVLQEKRGLGADVFSLGCVFLEMIAIIVSHWTRTDELQKLKDIRKNNVDGDTSYQANVHSVRDWLQKIQTQHYDRLVSAFTNPGRLYTFADVIEPDVIEMYLPSNITLLSLLPKMLDPDPGLRPSTTEIIGLTYHLCCPKCKTGPEPLEANGGFPA